jgi:hypothetical protein
MRAIYRNVNAGGLLPSDEGLVVARHPGFATVLAVLHFRLEGVGADVVAREPELRRAAVLVAAPPVAAAGKIINANRRSLVSMACSLQ